MVDGLLSRLCGLRAYRPVEEEPKDRFRVVVEFVPPFGLGAVCRGWFLPLAWQEREFLDSIWVVSRIGFRTLGYRGNIIAVFRQWHSTSQFNRASDENRRALVTLQIRAAHK
jgi:hypothetical protein